MRAEWLLTLFFLWGSYALDYYVSPTGRDQNPGTSVKKPFLSLSAAQTAVRAAIAEGRGKDITIHIADGIYTLQSPLRFTAADSGKNGHTVLWKATGSNALISGGTKLTGWKLDRKTGIYSTKVPLGTKSRNLFVGGSAAQYARASLDRSTFTFDNYTMTWTNSTNDWLASLPGIENTEIRAINSFTDRYSPVKSASAGQLVMDQPAWINNVWGWDTIQAPFGQMGFYIQNALSLLTEENEYFLDSSRGKIYYKPLPGQNMDTISTYLGRLECLISISGTYDAPAHNIAFQSLNFVRYPHDTMILAIIILIRLGSHDMEQPNYIWLCRSADWLIYWQLQHYLSYF